MAEVATNALTVQDRAVAALGLSNLEEELIELAGKSKDLIEVTNSDSYKQIDAARKMLKTERIDISKKGKAARDDANAFSKAVIAEENRLVAIIQVEEQRLQDLQKEHDEKVAAARQKLIDDEVARVEAIQLRISNMRDAPSKIGYTATSDDIQGTIDVIQNIEIDDAFEEFSDTALSVKTAALVELNEILAAAREREEQAAKFDAEREELGKRREEQDKREAEEARKASEKQDAIDAEELRLKKERDIFENEKRAEEERKSAEAQAEKDRIAREEQAEEDRKQAAADAGRRAEYPGEAAIVSALGEHFDVPDAVVISWLTEIRKAA